MYMPFICKSCEISFPTQKKFDAHCATKKHISKSNEKFSFLCKCGKSYAYKTNLHRHWRNWPYTIENDSQNHHILSSQNGKITTVIGGTVVHNETYIRNEIKNEITENNIINPTFNFNFYLNEHCKDAVNLSEFVKSIVVQIDDLERTRNVGFVRGVTDIIVRNLKQLDVYSRPIHCSDAVQEIMYVKNDDIWAEDTKNKPMVRGAIDAVAKMQIEKVKDWEEFKNTNNGADNVTAEYISLVRQATNSEKDGQAKIIKNIAREVVLNKSSK